MCTAGYTGTDCTSGTKSLLLRFNKCSGLNPRLVVSGDYTGLSLCRYGTIIKNPLQPPSMLLSRKRRHLKVFVDNGDVL